MPGDEVLPSAGDTGMPAYGAAYNKLRRVSCQLTGQMSRYEKTSEEEKYSVFYCSMFFFLLSSFISGIIMTAFGGMSITTCPLSWVPTWLLVEGLTISALFIVLFCGENKAVYYVKVSLVIIVFLFLASWSFLGIVWSSLDENCSYELSMFSLITSIIFSVLVICGTIMWTYWCFKSAPCGQHQNSASRRIEHMMTIIEEE